MDTIGQLAGQALGPTGLAQAGPAAAAAAPTSTVKGFFQTEWPMGLLPLQLLTVFPPTGLAGLNWFAVGQPITGIVKVLTFGVGILYGMLYMKYFPSGWSKAANFITTLGPWYIYDVIQVLFDPAFKDNGFQAPIPIEGLPVGGGVDGKWTLTVPLIGMIIAVLTASGIAIAQYLPPGTLDPQTAKIVNYATTGGGVLIGGLGLIGAFMMAKPTTAATVRGSSADQVLEATAAAAAQTGGGRAARKRLPPLSTFVDSLMERSEGGRQTETFQAMTFLGLLLLVAVSGLVINAV